MYIYIHITCINNYIDVINKMMEKIKKSNLYDNITEIRITLIGNSSSFVLDPKMVIIHTAELGTYENETINRIDVPLNCPVLYLHSKGVTKPQHYSILDWVELITYYIIENWRVCIKQLESYDTVGVNLSEKPKLHYSGNMWWTTGNHLKNIGKLQYKSYLDSEMYVCQKGNHISLYNSYIDHYQFYYNRFIYENKFQGFHVKVTYKDGDESQIPVLISSNVEIKMPTYEL